MFRGNELAFKQKTGNFESSQVKIEIGLREKKSTENESCSSPKTAFLPKNELPEFEIFRILWPISGKLTSNRAKLKRM
ncbi:hypothetical protein LSS_21485 [Leptospira santarosai serovar Shermani str. LT 821]|uniref:Uncharacterized protein n=1 Tax=Leptospira santarosai serovar Shermani str. LT 821 TaxID=758847 RepID=A0A097ESH5_9LEPT|nr:hypothetical protein LSS_21485 [Leptospira santarosai serovar Shermani str. LT 821]EPG83549.1 hypothetical protein LEP1GSC048_0251 [Leptospira santarosai serovar Shermani str. 1342KT]